MSKQLIIHKDIAGRDIQVDQLVVAALYNTIVVGKVIALTPKKVRYRTIYCGDYKIPGRITTQYPHRLAIIDTTPHLITLILKGTPS